MFSTVAPLATTLSIVYAGPSFRTSEVPSGDFNSDPWNLEKEALLRPNIHVLGWHSGITGGNVIRLASSLSLSSAMPSSVDTRIDSPYMRHETFQTPVPSQVSHIQVLLPISTSAFAWTDTYTSPSAWSSHYPLCRS